MSNQLIEVILNAATSLAILAHEFGRSVVVLGRDGWHLVPLLRSMDVKCQYFLWSRESHNAETAQQWEMEILPGSIVVDTGFAGSIFDIISRMDTIGSFMFRLVSSEGRYEQILSVFGHEQLRNLVLEWEGIPKLLRRCRGYDRFIPLEMDEDDRDSDIMRRNNDVEFTRRVTRLNYRMLRRLGLNREVSQTYASFTGQSIQERVGLNGEELIQHLLQVSRTRLKQTDKLETLLRVARKKETNTERARMAHQEEKYRLYAMLQQIKALLIESQSVDRELAEEASKNLGALRQEFNKRYKKALKAEAKVLNSSGEYEYPIEIRYPKDASTECLGLDSIRLVDHLGYYAQAYDYITGYFRKWYSLAEY